jgi:hypothetical protein
MSDVTIEQLVKRQTDLTIKSQLFDAFKASVIENLKKLSGKDSWKYEEIMEQAAADYFMGSSLTEVVAQIREYADGVDENEKAKEEALND